MSRRPAAAVSAAAVLAAASLASIGLSSSAGASTSVGPAETSSPNPVVRGDSVNIDVDYAGQMFYRGSSTAAYAPATPAQVILLGSGACRGDDATTTTGNRSPRTVVTVAGPGGEVLSRTSPVRDTSLGQLLASPQSAPLNPQPGPASTNYRGDFAPTANTPHGMHVVLDLAGKPAGTYTVTTTTTNWSKSGLGACVQGTPDAAGNVVPGPVVETDTFDYRPWQHNFKDVFGAGKVSMNVTPHEFQFSIGNRSSAVHRGTAESMSTYSLDGSFLLPSDPRSCVALVADCLPSAAVQCEPGTGCVPRLVVIGAGPRGTSPDRIFGVFDLKTKAFVADVAVGGSSRYMASVGSGSDAYYKNALQQLSAGAAKQGIDLPALLASEVIVRDSQSQTSLSLLNGLQIDPSSKPGGVHLSSSSTVQAGVLLDVYTSLRLDGESCVTNRSSSTSTPDRYQRNLDHGYTVTKTDLLPAVPSTGPLGAIVGGPVYHITGTFRDDALINTASAVIGVDTAADEPNGYPVWVQPFVSAPMHVAKPRTLDFVGTATWSASESPLGASGCLVVDFMLGTGVAVLNNPLPVGLGALIDATGQPNPEMAKLYAAVDDAVGPVLDSVTSQPVVDEVLTTVLDGLALPGL